MQAGEVAQAVVAQQLLFEVQALHQEGAFVVAGLHFFQQAVYFGAEGFEALGEVAQGGIVRFFNEANLAGGLGEHGAQPHAIGFHVAVALGFGQEVVGWFHTESKLVGRRVRWLGGKRKGLAQGLWLKRGPGRRYKFTVKR